LYFTDTVAFSGIALFISHHIAELDLQSGTFTDLMTVASTTTTQAHAFARMTRSPDNSFILVAAATGSAVSPTAWQVPRINPLASPVVDILTIPTPSANEVVEDFIFTSGGSGPFTVCMLARDDSTYAPRFFTVGATTPSPAGATSGASVPGQFGGEMSPDLAHNRIFVS